MPEIVFMIGYPGSGKSTYIKNHYPNHVHISSDKYIEEYAVHNNVTYRRAFAEFVDDANRLMFAEFQTSVKARKNMVVDRMNLHHKSRNKFIAQLPQLYYIKYVVFDIDLAILLNRNKERKKYGRHVNPCTFITPIKLPDNYIGVSND